FTVMPCSRTVWPSILSRKYWSSSVKSVGQAAPQDPRRQIPNHARNVSAIRLSEGLGVAVDMETVCASGEISFVAKLTPAEGRDAVPSETHDQWARKAIWTSKAALNGPMSVSTCPRPNTGEPYFPVPA